MQIRASPSRMYRCTLSPSSSRRRRIGPSARLRRSKVSAAASPPYSSRGPSEYSPPSVRRTMPSEASSPSSRCADDFGMSSAARTCPSVTGSPALPKQSMSSLAFSRTDITGSTSQTDQPRQPEGDRRNVGDEQQDHDHGRDEVGRALEHPF